MPIAVRVLPHSGEDWLNLNDLRDRLNDDEAILEAAAMLKVSKVEHHDSAFEAVRKAIAYFIYQAAGILPNEEAR